MQVSRLLYESRGEGKTHRQATLVSSTFLAAMQGRRWPVNKFTRVAVVEALRGSASSHSTSDTSAEMTTTGEQAPRKRRKFRLVTTVDDTQAVSTDDILLKLRTR